MEITCNELAQLLDRNDYRVVVQTTDGGCIAQFPERVEEPTPGFVCLYQEFTPEGISTYEYDMDGEELTCQHTDCPVYAQRLFTLYQIIYHCMGIGYNVQLIKFLVDDKEVDEDSFFRANQSPYVMGLETNEETKLRQLMGDCFSRGFQPVHAFAAQNEGIEEGFTAIRRLFMPDPIMNGIMLNSELFSPEGEDNE